jgi:hypothetical protein
MPRDPYDMVEVLLEMLYLLGIESARDEVMGPTFNLTYIFDFLDRSIDRSVGLP